MAWIRKTNDFVRLHVVLLKRLLTDVELTALVLPQSPSGPSAPEANDGTTTAKRAVRRQQAAKRAHSQERTDAPRPHEPNAPAETHDPFTSLNSHRLAEFNNASNATLKKLLKSPSIYRELATEMTEYTIRNRCYTARKFSSNLVYALSDSSNPERARCNDIRSVWDNSGDEHKPFAICKQAFGNSHMHS